MRFGYFALGLYFSFLGDLNAVHEFSDHDDVLFRKDDVVRMEIEMSDVLLL